MHAARRYLTTLLAVASLAIFAAPALAQTPAPTPAVASASVPLDAVWLSRFERSWGEIGMYVRENPNSIDGLSNSRVNLQRLNDAAVEFAKRQPGVEPTPPLLQAEGLVPELLPRPSTELYEWSAAQHRMTSTLGEPASLNASARILLSQVSEVVARFEAPNRFVQERWNKLMQDSNAPDLLRNEVAARRLFSELWDNQDARDATACQANLSLILVAAQAYALHNHMDRGARITINDAASTGLMSEMSGCPRRGKYTVAIVGELPRCSVGGAHLCNAPEKIDELRKASLEARLIEKPDDPVALALLARLSPDEQAGHMIDRAVSLAPNVPALRLERLAYNARIGNEDAAGADVRWLLETIPAASVLHDIDVATQRGALAQSPEFRAALLTKMADLRPDVLFIQTRAILACEAAGKHDESRRLYDRLGVANPGFLDILVRP
jgi:hypothetical protein